jgi:ADP-ribose pyrophosphatase YjhB (NUDIX family)
MDRPQKVIAYIVRHGRLVVFRHAGEPFEQSGLQVPAGTMHHGEPAADAVLREAREETQLEGLRIERYLGAGEYDLRPYADAIHVRHYFQLSVDAAEIPERWRACERGDGDADPIEFELYWLPLAQAHVIAAGQAAFVGRMLD